MANVSVKYTTPPGMYGARSLYWKLALETESFHEALHYIRSHTILDALAELGAEACELYDRVLFRGC